MKSLRRLKQCDYPEATHKKLIRSVMKGRSPKLLVDESFENKKRLRHYISWRHLLHLINNKKLTLSDSKKWNDINDRHSMQLYSRLNGNASVFAMCMTDIKENFHHWHIYGGKNKSDKICIIFNKEKLIRAISKNINIKFGKVSYRDISSVRNSRFDVIDIPFIKRIQFSDECEYRILWSGDSGANKKQTVSIPLGCIEQILFGPWVYISSYEKRKAMLVKKIIGSDSRLSIKVDRTHLIQSPPWIKALAKRFA